MKKVLISFIAIIFFSTIFLTPIKVALASAATGIVFDIPTELATIGTKIKEWGLDKIVKFMAGQMLKTITNDVKKWATSGFNGEPYFITDFKGALLDAADKAAGELISEIAQT